jgi:hypothetical protein
MFRDWRRPARAQSHGIKSLPVNERSKNRYLSFPGIGSHSQIAPLLALDIPERIAYV